MFKPEFLSASHSFSSMSFSKSDVSEYNRFKFNLTVVSLNVKHIFNFFLDFPTNGTVLIGSIG